MVAAPGTGTCDDQHDVGIAPGTPDLRGECARVVGLHVADEGPSARLLRPGSKKKGVAVGDVARPERRPDRPDLIPGRDDRDDRLPRDLQPDMTRRGGGSQIGRAQAVASRDEQLAGLEVLAGGTHVQPARRRAGDLGAAAGAELDPLALYHRVHAGRQQVAGVHPDELGGTQLPDADLAGGGLDSDAIHRGTSETGRGPAGADASGRHPAKTVPHRHVLRRGHALPARGHAGVDPPCVGGRRAGPRGRCGGGWHAQPCSRSAR